MIRLTAKTLPGIGLLIVFLVIMLTAAPVWARENRQDGPEPSHFGGPHTVPAYLAQDFHDRSLIDITGSLIKSYWEFKDRIKKDYGLDYGIDYTAMIQYASASPGENLAASGAIRFYGTWELLGRGTQNSGSLVYKVENRHLLGTEISPQALGSEVGYDGLTAVPFSDEGWALTNLFWQQHLWEGRFSFLAGVVDATDYVDTYGFVDTWTMFANLAFSNGPTMPVPNQGLGAVIRAMLTGNIYLSAGLADANSDPTNSSKAWESFFNTAEYFKHVELGWIDSYKRRFTDNIHITAWQADARDELGIPSGWGLSFSYNQIFAKKWEPFVRAGYADEGGALWERTLAAGLGYYTDWKSGLIALGLSWGRPSEASSGDQPRDQYTAEIFYKVDPIHNLTIIPDLQLIWDPSLNPDQDFIAVLGLRARLSF